MQVDAVAARILQLHLAADSAQSRSHGLLRLGVIMDVLLRVHDLLPMRQARSEPQPDDVAEHGVLCRSSFGC